MAPHIKAPTRALAPAGSSVLALTGLTTEDVERTLGYAENEKAPRTRHIYAADFRDFGRWCAGRGLPALPADAGTVAAYLSALAGSGLRAATIGRKVAAIGYRHRIDGHPSPTANEGVRAVMRGIRRTIGTASTHRKAAATADIVEQMLAACSDNLAGIRDRALIAVGFASAMRRSELVALETTDLAEHREGIIITIRRSKTDQEGQGQQVALPHGSRIRPVEHLARWLDAASIADGRVFRSVVSGHVGGSMTAFALSLRIKLLARRAGLDAATFSGHSLRAGYVSSAVQHGASPVAIAEQTRHRSLDMILAYNRRLNRFKQHSGAAFL